MIFAKLQSHVLKGIDHFCQLGCAYGQTSATSYGSLMSQMLNSQVHACIILLHFTCCFVDCFEQPSSAVRAERQTVHNHVMRIH